jgi:hypothetical protein
MSAPINDGGPAFPHFKTDPFSSKVEICPQGGMTLRDWFAGQALAGLLSDQTIKCMPDDFAESAYLAADAMLAAREATK